MTSPRRILAGFTGAVLIAVAFQIHVDGVIFDPDLWALAFFAAGAGQLVLAARPSLSTAARAVIAVVTATALAARSLALIVVLIRFPNLAGPSTLIGALIWPLVGSYIVAMLAYWPHLGEIARTGGRRDRSD